MTALTDVLAWHRAQVGTTEEPDGSNQTPYGVVYGWNGVPWCDIYQCVGAEFVTGSDEAVFGKYAWTVGHARAFEAAGRWGAEPRLGALVFFDWSGGKNIEGIDHVGIVVGDPLPDGRIPTIEGNVGNRVQALLRTPSHVVGYGYPSWCEDRVAAAPSPVPPFPGYARMGQRGVAVRAVQQRLRDRGWRIVVDGVFGSQTLGTVKAFQREKGLQVDGIAGPATWRALWLSPVT